MPAHRGCNEQSPSAVGDADGFKDGDALGLAVGDALGFALGLVDGALDGLTDGDAVGALDGMLGDTEGLTLGCGVLHALSGTSLSNSGSQDMPASPYVP